MERVNCNLCGFDSTIKVIDYKGYAIVRCARCGLVYVNPRPSKEDFATLNKEHFKRGCDDDSACSKMLEKCYRKVAKQLIKLFPNRGKMLDIGCGCGRFLEIVKTYGWQVTGIDPSPGVIKRAAKKGFPVYCSTIEDITYVQNSYGQKSFSKKSFDCITMFFVLEHLPDPMEALLKVFGLLKEGGLLVTMVPYVTPIAKILDKLLKVFKSDCILFDAPYQLYDFSPQVLMKMLDLAGFSAVEIIPGIPVATEKTILRTLVNIEVLFSKLFYRLSRGELRLPAFGHTIYAWKRTASGKSGGS